MAILAVQAIRKMRGGSQSQLMRCEDQNLWVVKFQNNPQHLLILANELIATRLAAEIGLSVPLTEIIEVRSGLISNTADLRYESIGTPEKYAPGLQFGSKFVGGLWPGTTVDFLPDQLLDEVRNLEEFCGVLCFDKWTGNVDRRQAVFTRRGIAQTYHASFIDQGFCFNAAEWTFPDPPLRGIYERKRVYAKVSGWNSFEPWLSRIEAIQRTVLEEIIATVPPEWLDENRSRINYLIKALLDRRSQVRELLLAFRRSDRGPFPNWI